MEFVSDQMCFACGRENPIGLKLIFREEGTVYAATFVAEAAHQGYQGIVHGGIIATLLDEIMARLVWARYGRAATAKLDIRYRQPAPTGTPLEVRGWITAERRGGRAMETAGDLRLSDGTLLAAGTALVIRL